MVACAVLSGVFASANITPIQKLKSRHQLSKVGQLACIFCFSIVFGIVSLKYIPVSFDQVLASTTPFFTAAFAFILQGEPGASTCLGTVLTWRH